MGGLGGWRSQGEGLAWNKTKGHFNFWDLKGVSTRSWGLSLRGQEVEGCFSSDSFSFSVKQKQGHQQRGKLEGVGVGLVSTWEGEELWLAFVRTGRRIWWGVGENKRFCLSPTWGGKGAGVVSSTLVSHLGLGAEILLEGGGEKCYRNGGLFSLLM